MLIAVRLKALTMNLFWQRCKLLSDKLFEVLELIFYLEKDEEWLSDQLN